MAFILWLIAVVLVIYGIVRIVQGEVLLGAVLIIVGLLIGPGGVSIFSTVSAADLGSLLGALPSPAALVT
ncbi:MAG TPA: GPGG-motif small membrane protein [Acidimicrobiales bacterium]|nr:GPGG-motif small membrane protein [Acidimicrobiales bacterium]